MITAEEYRVENKKLMEEYEAKVREWLKKEGCNNIADDIPFFRDGVTNPDVWFKEGNEFRPLFILKEVSIGKDKTRELYDFLKEWGNTKTFEFVENPFDDIKIGTFRQWMRIARFAKALEETSKGNYSYNYSAMDFSYKKGREIYIGDIDGYKKYKPRTANQNYLNTVDKIAILEIKKVGGGTNVASEISCAT